MAQIETIDTDDGREFRINGRIKDLVDTLTWKSRARYVSVMDIPTHFFLNPGTALLFGIGSGSITKNYHRQQWTVHVAEPDLNIFSSATRNFQTPSSDTTVFRIDGRQYLETQTKQYNIILVDGIAKGGMPCHMLTKEFFLLVKEHLLPDGMFAIAFESIGWHDPLVRSISTTMAQVFKETIVLPIAEPPNAFGSIVVIASNTKRDILRDPERNYFLNPDWRYGPEYQKVHAWDNHFVPDTGGGIILTDNYNRLDTLFTRIADSAKVQQFYYLP